MPAGRDLTDEEFIDIRRSIKGAMRRLARSNDYDDFYQSCWVAVLSALPRFSPEKGSLRSYAYTIAKGSLLDRFEKEGNRARILPRVPLDDHAEAPLRPESNLSDDEETALWNAIGSIRPCHAKALVDRYVHDMTVRDIAAKAGVVIRTADAYITKARRALRVKLGEVKHEESRDVT